MTAHRAFPLTARTGGPASGLALSFGTPVGIVLGFFGGWILGSVILRPPRTTSTEAVAA
jgi:ABC-type dipeptide/oligopeptide/nickel transport system permease subunit